MNYLFLLNQGPEYFSTFNSIAQKLKDHGHKITYACTSRYPAVLFDFIKSDSEIIYFSDFLKTHSPSLEDISRYLKYNLWEMFYSDFERYEVYGYHLKKTNTKYPHIVKCLIHFFEHIIINDQIHTIIYEDVSNSFAYAAYIVTQEHNIQYIGLSFPRLPNRHELVDKPFYGNEKLKEIYYKLVQNEISPSEEIINIADKYLSNFLITVPDYMLNNPLKPNKNPFEYFKIKRFSYYRRILKYKFIYDNDNKFNYQAPVFQINLSYIKRNLRRTFNAIFLENIFDVITLNNSYYFYPIHYHPEASTSVLAKHYTDEYNNILNIAINIPFGQLLYVKEHISNYGNFSKSFYSSIKNIPNVRLIHYNANTKEIIKKSLAVITITSTVGFEAIILNKRVFVLGKAFYDFHPLCTKVNSFEEIFQMLKEKNNVKEYNPVPFIQAYYMSTYEGTINYKRILNTDDIQLTHKIASEIESFQTTNSKVSCLS